ncbi:MAG: photosynthesis system II assembly factor Ycf48 [Cyanophyceae cyanobacterium]
MVGLFNALKRLKRLVPLLAIALLCASCSKVPSLGSNPWELVELPTEKTILDITFDPKGDRGWMVGKGATLLTSTDGGKTWADQSFDFGDGNNYNLSSVSFDGDEGWVVGKPSLLLHTGDGGRNWSRIPLSNKLPGDPTQIFALGRGKAEMVTDLGAIYQTQDAGQHWKALVQEAVGVVRNIQRSTDGRYVSVSSRGNYYSTWNPGDESWQQHNRTSSRRLQNMGFTPDGRLWAIARGGQVQFGANGGDDETWEELQSPEVQTSWGFLDIAYRTPEELWLAGGSGNLLYSPDGGETWMKDREIESVPSNLYKVAFFGTDRGFILGQEGIVLRYNSAIAPQASDTPAA